MSGPLIFIIIVAVVDIFLKSLREKNKADKRQERKMPNSQKGVQGNKDKKGSTISELRRTLEEELGKQAGKVKKEEPKKPLKKDTKIQTPQDRALEAENKRLERQREKIKEHSELEKSSRLKRDNVLTKTRLGESQSTLSSKDSKRRLGDIDLSVKKPVSIELEDTSKEIKGSRKYSKLNIKEDILKGIIYSEILSKPKSLNNKDM